MYVRRYRNVPLKRGFDRLLGEPVARGAELVVAVSELERAELIEAGLEAGAGRRPAERLSRSRTTSAERRCGLASGSGRRCRSS